ncbi:MAG: methionyl-tRNA formyltransferase [Patescibacteria group bacterium]
MEENKKIIFWGTPQFSLPSIESLFSLGLVAAVVTQADKPAGRNRQPKSSPIKQFAQKHQLPVISPLKLDDDFVSELKKYLPATFVVVAYGKIIKQAVLDLSARPTINIHPSILPALRGPSPIQTALRQGLSETGVSLMQLDAQMDHGPILAQIKLKIEPNDDYLSLSERLAALGAKLLSDNIIKYLAGVLPATAQDDSQATFCKLINKEQGEIDWHKPATEILNQIRAFRVWPTSYTRLNNLELKIIQARLASINLAAQEVLIREGKLYIGTGAGALEIISLQPANKKIMTAAEFVRGYGHYFSK